MKSRLLTIVGIAILSLSLLTMGCTKRSRETVVIKGSTTVLPITQKAAEAFRKVNNVSISIEGSGSGNGIKALLEGNCDIANSSRDMKDREKKKAAAKGIKVRVITVALDMVCPVVHPSNPVKNLTLDQLRAIYDGSINNWKEIGGKDEKIVVVSRDTSSGTYEVWHKIVMKKKDVRKDALLQASNGAVLATISKNPKAIGYIGFGYVNDTIKPITVNSIQPTMSNGKSGKFPVSRNLFMFVNEEKMTKNTKSFIDFLLSKEGQELVEEAGFIPL